MPFTSGGAPSNPLVWTFTQLFGANGAAPKTQTLGGWSAPFGRPRNGSMFNAGLEVRYARTDYPGRNLQPTIHTFGTKKKPVEMHGRWMDRLGSAQSNGATELPGIGGALKMTSDWQEFISDQIPVRMTWGSLISYQVFIYDIDLNVEGANDVVWAMKMQVLVDEQAAVGFSQALPSLNPLGIAYDLDALIGGLNPFSLPSFSSLLGTLNQISDALNTVISTINAPFAAIFNVCSAISSFETAVSSDLTSLTSGITAMQDGIQTLQGTTDNLFSGVSQLNNTSNAFGLNGVNGGLLTGADVVQFASAKQASDIAAVQMLNLLGTLQVQVDRVRRGGQPQSAYIAQYMDTWESIAQRVIGSADGARKLRAMNGIKHGDMPVPGRTYTVPR